MEDKNIFFPKISLLHPPSKTVTPAADVEGEEDGDGVFRHRNYKVEACDLGLNVSVFRGAGVVLEIKIINILDPPEIAFKLNLIL